MICILLEGLKKLETTRKPEQRLNLTIDLRRKLKVATDEIKIDEKRNNEEWRLKNDIRFEKMEKELNEQIKKLEDEKRAIRDDQIEIDDDNEYAKAHDIAFFIAEAKNPKSFQPKESYPQLELVKDIHNCDAIKN